MKNRYWIIPIIFAIIVFGTMLFYSPNKEQPIIIGNDTDEHGCLIDEGYSWNESFGLCLIEWGLDSGTRRALNISLSEIGTDRNVSLKKIQSEPCTGCYIIVFKEKDNEITFWIENWKVLESRETHNCKQEERNTNACIEIYDPVCANNHKTYSNGCFACQDLEVDYYRKGEC